MPKVPRIQENQRLAPQNPTGFQSSSQARLMGDAISQVGEGVVRLGQNIQRIKNASAVVARQDARNLTNDALERLNNEYAKRGYDPKNRENYEKDKQKALADVNKTLTAKYGAEYANDINVYGRQAEEQWDTKFGVMDQKQFASHFKNNMDQVRASYASQASKSPEDVEIIKNRAAGDMYALGKALNLSDTQSLEGLKQVEKSIVMGAIDGRQNQSDVANVRFPETLSILDRNDHLFTPEEKKKLQTEIKNNHRSTVRFEAFEVDRQERLNEAAREKSSQLKAVQLMEEVEKAAESGNPVAMRAAETKAFKEAKKGNLTYQNFGGVLTKSTKGWQQIDNTSKYRVRKLVYSGAEPKDFAKGRSMVYALKKSKAMLPSTASALLKEFDESQKKFDSDPIYKQKYKAAQQQMNKILGDQTTIEAKIAKYDSEDLRRQLNKIHGAKQIFHEMIAIQASLGKSVDPMVAAAMALEAVDYEGLLQQEAATGIPLYKKSLKDSTSADIAEYIELLENKRNTEFRFATPIQGIQIDSHISRFKAQLEFMRRRESFLNREQMRNERDKTGTPLPSDLLPQNNDVMRNMLNSIEGLNEPDERGVPYIFRLEEPEY